jgi:hypothetical protein
MVVGGFRGIGVPLRRSVVSPGSFVLTLILATMLGNWSEGHAQSAGSSPTKLILDHALICTSDLVSIQQAFADVNLAPDFGGHHGHAATQMAQLGFQDGTYIGIEAPAIASTETNTPQSALMKANAGPCGWSVTSTDMKADLERLSRLGVKVGVPEGRSRTRPDGTTAEWQSASVGAGAPGSNLPFLIQDKTPRSNRAPRPSPSTVGTGLTGVAMVVLGVKNLNENIALFRKAYDWPAPRIEDHPEYGAKLAYFAGTPVILAAPSAPNSWLAQRLEKLDQCPIAFLLGTRDWKSTAAHFSQAPATNWFNLNISWFDVNKLQGVRLGVVGQ